MTIIQCSVDDRTFAILTEYGQRNGRTVEDLAECAIAEAALHAIPPQARAAVQRATLDTHCDHTNLNAEGTRCLGCGMWAHQFVRPVAVAP